MLVVVKVKFNGTENVILLNDFVQNVHVQRKAFYGFQIFDKFVAKWASNSVVLLEFGQTISAESVAAVDQNSWNALANVVLQCAELTKVKASCFIVCHRRLLATFGFLHIDLKIN